MEISIWEWMYAFLWCLLLLGAAFPSIFVNCDFSFLNTSGDRTKSDAYLFSVVMIIVVHLLDMVHIISSEKIMPDKMKKGFIQTLVSIMLLVISLILINSFESYAAKIFLFVLFWGILLVYKVFCIQITGKKVRKLVKVRN
ncbi:MAG: hypothetical protein LBL79_15165 [Prevotella sp.]|jgi:hypothetical protein|nr:hypothetical protein [Prevotella sp.]